MNLPDACDKVHDFIITLIFVKYLQFDNKLQPRKPYFAILQIAAARVIAIGISMCIKITKCLTN